MDALNDGLLDLDFELENGVGFPMEDDDDIQKAVRVLLEGLGEDADREGLRRTPLRVAKALQEGTRGSLFFLLIFILCCSVIFRYDTKVIYFFVFCCLSDLLLFLFVIIIGLLVQSEKRERKYECCRIDCSNLRVVFDLFRSS